MTTAAVITASRTSVTVTSASGRCRHGGRPAPPPRLSIPVERGPVHRHPLLYGREDGRERRLMGACAAGRGAGAAVGALGVAEVGAGQVGAAQHGPLQIGAAEVHLRRHENGMMMVRAVRRSSSSRQQIKNQSRPRCPSPSNFHGEDILFSSAKPVRFTSRRSVCDRSA